MRCKRTVGGIVLLLFLVLAGRGVSATITVSNFTSSAIQSAIDSASNGDTIYLPKGSYDFSNTVTLTKSLTLQGEGVLMNVGVVEPGTENEDPYWWSGLSRCYTTHIDLTFFTVQKTSPNLLFMLLNFIRRI